MCGREKQVLEGGEHCVDDANYSVFMNDEALARRQVLDKGNPLSQVGCGVGRFLRPADINILR